MRWQVVGRLLSVPEVLQLQDPELHHNNVPRSSVPVVWEKASVVMAFLVLKPDGLFLIGRDADQQIGGPAQTFAASPDGLDVAVITTDAGEVSIAVKAIRGHDEFVPWLIEGGAVYGRPTWHPRGDRVTIARSFDDGDSALLTVSRDGEAATLQPFRARHVIAEPMWSASGKYLAFEAQPIDTLRGMTVYLHEPRTGQTSLVAPNDEPLPKAACGRFGKGDRLVYTESAGGVGEAAPFVYSPRTKKARALPGIGINEPRWSRDGSELLVAVHHGVCETSLAIIDVERGAGPDLVEAPPGHHEPISLSARAATFIVRPCAVDDEVPVVPGELWSVDRQTREVGLVARDVLLAEVV